ncbi:MAG TPA: chromate resistance protein ChrB domain-containing protein [Kofleriaceae bacterium]|nr:chromate resistance protein ChrB domain-containing protein [Kofleriaceae bacterium]
MIWVTKRRIKVNRAATAWLIRRFIDPQGEIRFVAPDEVERVQREEGALGFDAPNATYPHKDNRGRCSFEALVEQHVPHDPALARMARIVHCADFRDEIDLVPEARGLRAISDGFPLVARDDDDTVSRASFLYDAMYAALDEEAHRIA